MFYYIAPIRIPCSKSLPCSPAALICRCEGAERSEYLCIILHVVISGADRQFGVAVCKEDAPILCGPGLVNHMSGYGQKGYFCTHRRAGYPIRCM
jgi:hypothetical protein